MNNDKLYGTSLSLCVKSILNKEVSVDQVIAIYCRSLPCQEVFDQYKQTYWEQFTDREISQVIKEITPKIRSLQRYPFTGNLSIGTGGTRTWLKSKQEVKSLLCRNGNSPWNKLFKVIDPVLLDLGII